MKSVMKKAVRTLTIVMAFAAVCTFAIPMNTEAAAPKLNKTRVTMSNGKSCKLKVRNTGRKIRWKSNKKSVATVDSTGRVRGKKAGTATITARVGKRTLKCRVQVVQPSSAASGNVGFCPNGYDTCPNGYNACPNGYTGRGGHGHHNGCGYWGN